MPTATSNDVRGRTFGQWTVTGSKTLKNYARVRIMVPCRCTCGTEKLVELRSLESGDSTKCVRCAASTKIRSRIKEGTKVAGLLKLMGDGKRRTDTEMAIDMGWPRRAAVTARRTLQQRGMIVPNPPGKIIGKDVEKAYVIAAISANT